MPLIKRLVEPVHISRAVVPTQINNELEFVGNSALANIMRQLGTLSAHADDLFAELHRDAASLLYRVGQLTERVERVQARIVKLNPIVEEGVCWEWLLLVHDIALFFFVFFC